MSAPALEREPDDLFYATAIVTKPLEGRRILIVSDIHSGGGGPRDNFRARGNELKLLACLEHLLHQAPDRADEIPYLETAS